MSNTIKIVINWTKLMIALALMCLMFSFSAMAQDNPNKPLDQEEVEALINQLKEGLPELIDDEDAVNEIVGKWESREDLVGKTGEQALKMLFADVRSVVNDKEKLDAVWSNWTESREEEEESEGEEDKAQKQNVPQKPVETEQNKAGEEEEVGEEDWSTIDDSRKLNAQDVSLILADLQDELSDFIDNQAQIAAIVNKWRARKDLVGKTKADVTALLYADVKSIVKDKVTLDDIEDSWKVSDAITAPSATKQQQEALENLPKIINERAEKNLEIWRDNFQKFLLLGKIQEYDAEAVAGIYLMVKSDKEGEALGFALEGAVAFKKIQNRNLLPAEIKQMEELTLKLIGCESNCAAERQKLKKHGEAVLIKVLQPVFFATLLTDKNNMEKFLGGVVKEVYQGYQSMEFYDPYKLEAECRKNGGDELGCFESTYFGMVGYGIFGKQANERVHVDKKSIDLMNRWIKERLAEYKFNSKFECVKTETSSCGSLKPRR